MSRWFRFYSDAMRKPKVAKLSDKDFRLWVELLAVAAENDGSIPCLDDLKHLLRRRLDHLSTAVKRLISARLITQLNDGYAPHGWDKYQYKSDTSNERVAKHRAKRNVTVTPPETETETEVIEPSGSISREVAQKPKPKNSKGCRLPSDWKPMPLSDDLAKDVAGWPDGAVNRELARFRDWAASATGPNAIKKNWDAAWRNWLRKAHDEGRYGNDDRLSRSHSGQTDKRDGVARALDRRLGFNDPAGPPGRWDARASGGDRESTTPRLTAVR